MRKLVSVIGALALSGCTVVGVRTTEEPPHEVVERLVGGVEVRRYGPRLAAETVVAGGSDWDARSRAFRLLAGYIFGKNRQQAEIAMTAPVEIDGGGRTIAMTAPVETRTEAAGLVMRFFMPAGYTRATLPEPLDERVRIVELPSADWAVLRFTGSTSPAAVAGREAALLRALAGTAWQPMGEPVALFYDPPWTIPFLRRNEVAVPVGR